MMKFQIGEIAARCGVSSMTVSRALDPFRRHLVSEKRRREILDCCEKYGYEPNYSARTLASGRTYTVGLIQPWPQMIARSRTYGTMINCLISGFRKHNYFVTFLPIESGDPASFDQEIVKTFRSGRVDGYIAMAVFVGERALEEMRSRQFPIVTFNMPSDNIRGDGDLRRVRIDSAPGIEALFAHLRARGHRKIAYVGKGNLTKRDEIYCRLLESDDDFIRLNEPRYLAMDKHLAGYRLAAVEWERLRKYTAITCSNDEYAMGICEALRDRGVVPGKDVAVAGFDDSEEGRPEPFLTTVHPPIKEAAEECIRILLAQISAPGKAGISPVTVDARLVERASTQCSAYQPKQESK